jgi:hypothetical protein
MAPTAATATIMDAIFEMLKAASAADTDVALTLTDMWDKPNNIGAAFCVCAPSHLNTPLLQVQTSPARKEQLMSGGMSVGC